MASVFVKILGFIVLALVIAYNALTWNLQYPLRFYLPGLAGKLRRSVPYSKVQWLANETIAKNNRVQANVDVPKRQSKQPNIVLIVADDFGVRDIDTHVGTPNIMSIARNGVEFEKAYAGN